MTQTTRPLSNPNPIDDRKSHMVRNPMQPAASTLFGGWGPRLR